VVTIRVPLTTLPGVFFTVYVFLQLFGLVVPLSRFWTQTTGTLPVSHYLQAVVMYAIVGLTTGSDLSVGGPRSPVTDAAGVVWQTRSIAESGNDGKHLHDDLCSRLVRRETIQGTAPHGLASRLPRVA